LPWVSPGRGARVVVEIDSLMVGSLASSALTSVDLPAPDGAAQRRTGCPRMRWLSSWLIFQKRQRATFASPKDVFYQEQRREFNLQ
jgi:hypothetical protein